MWGRSTPRAASSCSAPTTASASGSSLGMPGSGGEVGHVRGVKTPVRHGPAPHANLSVEAMTPPSHERRPRPPPACVRAINLGSRHLGVHHIVGHGEEPLYLAAASAGVALERVAGVPDVDGQGALVVAALLDEVGTTSSSRWTRSSTTRRARSRAHSLQRDGRRGSTAQASRVGPTGLVGVELSRNGAGGMIAKFFDQLTERMRSKYRCTCCCR